MEQQEKYQTRALAVARSLTPDMWSMIEAVAPAMHRSRLFGVTAPEQAAAIMLKGYELGLGLAASFEFIHVIQGRPSLSPRGALALIHRSGELAKLQVQDLTDKKGTPTGCTVTMKRVNGFQYTVTFTLGDAKQAGIIKPDSGWQKYPANMLRWRAIGFCADVVFPDVIGGMKRADELGADITPDGDVIEGQAWEVGDQGAGIGDRESDNSKENPTPTLNDLVVEHGAETVLEANEGAIPETEEQVAAVAEKLGAGNGTG